ncbi:MAG: T9SS type A sorting domain-containing protein, partial [Chitinophagales bacterium]
LIFNLLLSSTVLAQNVMISDQNLPNEPAIKINPYNTAEIVAGANLNNCYYSSDTGHTWSELTMTSSFGVWGDPVIDVDTNGTFYFTHLSNTPAGTWIDRIVCQKSTDGGETWNDGTFFGLNGVKKQDKQWSIIDKTNNNIYITWTEFDDYGSSNPSDSSRILFTKSLDEGATWSTPLQINKVSGDCIDEDNTVEGAVPAIGANGEIYVSWAGPAGIRFDKSTDQGATWLNDDILINNMPTGWDYSIPGIDRANGMPITKCDLSGGENHGTIYVNWSDQRNGATDTDIWFAKSTDGGETWTNELKVNDDNTNTHQFFTWMDIDQTTGYLYIIFYDRRSYIDNQTDVYVAISKDGGETFENTKISEVPFLPNEGVFFGDYTNISVHNNIVRPIWTRLHNGELSIWTDVTKYEIEEEDTTTTSILNKEDNIEVNSFPNPTNDVLYVSYKVHEESIVSISIINENGQAVKSIVSSQERQYGKYIEQIDLKQHSLAKGQYYINIQVNDESKTLRAILID